MNFRVRAEAENNYVEAVNWYLDANLSPQSAERFSNEIESAYLRIQELPYRCTAREDNLRSLALKHFPFSVVYFIHQNEIVVVSIRHHRRSKPNA